MLISCMIKIQATRFCGRGLSRRRHSMSYLSHDWRVLTRQRQFWLGSYFCGKPGDFMTPASPWMIWFPHSSSCVPQLRSNPVPVWLEVSDLKIIITSLPVECMLDFSSGLFVEQKVFKTGELRSGPFKICTKSRSILQLFSSKLKLKTDKWAFWTVRLQGHFACIFWCKFWAFLVCDVGPESWKVLKVRLTASPGSTARSQTHHESDSYFCG